MEKAHNPESRLCSPCAGSVTVGCGPISLSPLRISTAAHFKHVCSGLCDFMTRDTSPMWDGTRSTFLYAQGCWQSWVFTAWEQSVDKYLALGQGLASSTWAAEAQQSPVAKTAVLTASFTKPKFHKCQSPEHWWFQAAFNWAESKDMCECVCSCCSASLSPKLWSSVVLLEQHS